MIIGKNTYISPKAKIIGYKTDTPKIIIGDNSYIGDDVQIICDDFYLGDYCKLHHHTNVHGSKIHIGHNAWVGQYSIIDGLGTTIIGDNCGIGAHSQLWSHIKYGDVLEGCRFLSESPLLVGNDVWFVGHCIVSPITAKDKSMALVGSVITKDMDYNNIYAGSPAKNITDKAGTQFKDISNDEKYKKLNNLLDSFGNSDLIKIVMDESEILDNEISYFCISTRKYTKRLSNNEIAFMKYLLPDKAKFTPLDIK